MGIRTVGAIGALGALASLALLVLVLQHAADAAYVLPPQAVVIGVAGALAATAGWLIVAWRRDGLFIGAVLAGLLVVGGLLSIFSVGILVIPAAIAAVIGVRRVADRRPADAPRLTPWLPLAVVLVGVGLPAAALAAADGPAVECREHGVAIRSSAFEPNRSWGSSGEAESDGRVTTGTAETGSHTFRYRCEGGRLTELERID